MSARCSDSLFLLSIRDTTPTDAGHNGRFFPGLLELRGPHSRLQRSRNLVKDSQGSRPPLPGMHAIPAWTPRSIHDRPFGNLGVGTGQWTLRNQPGQPADVAADKLSSRRAMATLVPSLLLEGAYLKLNVLSTTAPYLTRQPDL
jgi:hypothetical protein